MVAPVRKGRELDRNGNHYVTADHKWRWIRLG
jgi:hypothetical protein